MVIFHTQERGITISFGIRVTTIEIALMDFVLD
jgi:hypothetical protein